MNFYIGVTDYEWFRLHAAKQNVEEVNFWRPSPDKPFKVLQPGELLLFKLHSPQNRIAGGGFFTKFLQLPISLAWDAFGEANGVRSLVEMRNRIGKYRRAEIGLTENPNIGCILLAEPFFFPEHDWIPCPADFSLNTVSGKRYDAESETGKAIWDTVAERLSLYSATVTEPGPATLNAAESARYGNPMIVQPRLGQGSFRVLVTDAYSRRCAMTQERTLPVLEAAHIRPYSDGGKHELSNGLLLRSDLHTLEANQGRAVFVHRCACGGSGPVISCEADVDRVHNIGGGALVMFTNPAKLTITPPLFPPHGTRRYMA